MYLAQFTMLAVVKKKIPHNVFNYDIQHKLINLYKIKIYKIYI